MGVLTRVREVWDVLSGSREKSVANSWGALFAAGLENAVLGDASLLRPFAQHPTVYAAVSAIATNIAGLEREMFPTSDKKRERPVKDSVVLNLIEEPNEEMIGGQLIENTMQHLELYGNAYWHLSNVGRKRADRPRFPERIDLWEPERVTLDRKVRPLVWIYNGEAGQERAPAAEVVHFKYMNPYDSIFGIGPLQAAMIIAKGDYKSHVWNDAFFNNSAMPFGLLSPEPGQIVHGDSMTRLRDEFEARHLGPFRHGRIGATKMAMRFLEIGMNQKDMDFANLMDRATEKILMVFKVPPAFAGSLRDANYSASIQQAKQFWHNHLPKTDYLRRMVYARLCKPFGIEEMLWFKTESIKALTEDQESLSNQARNYFNMGVPFVQINDRLELGFDAESNESMNVPWIPFSLVNADEQAEAEPFQEPLGGPDPAESEPMMGPQPGDPPTQEEPEKRFRRNSKALSTEVLRAANWKVLITRIRDEEAAMQSRIRGHLAGLKAEVLANLRATKAVKAPAEFNIDAVLFDPDKAAEDIERRTDPLYKSALEKGVKTVIDELRLDIDFNLLIPEVERFLQEKRFQIADLVDGPAAYRLRAALREGLTRGESVEQIADRVEEAFSVERSRSRRIARTEIAESFNGGRYEGMKAASVEKIEWLTARDGRVREEHVRMDGETIRLGDTFSNGLKYPLDPSGPANEVVNCRCVPLPAA